LWSLVQKLEAGRGKPSDNSTQQVDYNFHIESEELVMEPLAIRLGGQTTPAKSLVMAGHPNDRVSITQRRRGSPIDKVVSELMILVNSEWGKHLAEHGFVGIYRTQQNGKVKMSTVAAPHQGLGVAQYMWSSSPLRRYVDMVNQRQIIAMLRDEEPAYPKNDNALYATMRDFDTMYTIYNDFQRNMERYWCLRWLQQENIEQVEAVVLRENLVKVAGIPLTFRVPSLPELPANTLVQLAIVSIDLLDLDIQTRFVAAITKEEPAEC